MSGGRGCVPVRSVGPEENSSSRGCSTGETAASARMLLALVFLVTVTCGIVLIQSKVHVLMEAAEASLLCILCVLSTTPCSFMCIADISMESPPSACTDIGCKQKLPANDASATMRPPVMNFFSDFIISSL